MSKERVRQKYDRHAARLGRPIARVPSGKMDRTAAIGGDTHQKAEKRRFSEAGAPKTHTNSPPATLSE